MNIIFYSNTFFPTIGGREVVMYQLGRALMARGHTVRVVGPQGYFEHRDFPSEIPVVRYPRISLGRRLTDRFEQRLLEFQMLPQLALDLTLRGADVIHSHILYPAGYVASLLTKRRSRKPLVLTPHGVDINVAEDRDYGMRLDRGLRLKIDRALNASDAVTAISEGIFDELRKVPVDIGKVHRIGNGIDLARFQGASTTSVRNFLNLPSSAKLVLTVGNYTPLKGHEDLIEALPLVLDKIPEAVLVIVGANTKPLQKLALARNVAKSVILTGPIPLPEPGIESTSSHDLLADIYKQSSVYVSASNREGAEGLSLSLLDAMAASLPVVATDIVGNRDVVQNGANGLLVPPGCKASMAASIVEILRNEQRAASMAQECLRVSEEFSWGKVAEQYERVYEEVVSKKSS